MTARVPWSRLLWPAAFALAFAVLAWIVPAHHPYVLDTGPHHWSVAHRPHAAVTAARLVTDTGTGAFPPLAAALGGWLAGLAAYGTGSGQGRGGQDGGTAGDEQAPEAAGGRMARARGALPTALLALLTLLAGQSLRTGLMVVLHRTRPPVADWAVRASGHSFPSGHTSSSAIAAGLLAWGLLRLGRSLPGGPANPGLLLSRAAAGLCCLAAAAVGCTRVYLGVHWPTDVLGGWLFAGFWLTATVPLLAYAAGQDRGGPWRPRVRRAARGDQTDTP